MCPSLCFNKNGFLTDLDSSIIPTFSPLPQIILKEIPGIIYFYL